MDHSNHPNQSIYKEEFLFLEHTNDILTNQNITKEELLLEYSKLNNKYSNILKQINKLVKIGDSTQNKLLKTQNELSVSNQKLVDLNLNLNVINHIGKMITSSLDPKKILEEANSHIKSIMDVAIFAIGLYDTESKYVRYKFCMIDGQYIPSMIKESIDDENFSSLCIRGLREFVINNIEENFSSLIPNIQKEWGKMTYSHIYLPLTIEDRIIGILTIQSENKNSYTEDHLSILRALASYISIAIDNADAYKNLSKNNKRLNESLDKIRFLNDSLNVEQQKSEKLLLNVLPKSIADRLKSKESAIADYFESASVLFADIAGFTIMSAQIKSPKKLVIILDTIFTDFDTIANKYELEKIKTIGDCYMLAGGIPNYTPDHLERLANAAIEMINVFESLKKLLHIEVNIRIGIHIGNVVAGVIGKNKFVYDLWGDAVNTASRMESHGQPQKIHCSKAVYEQLNDKFNFESRGEINVKGKGIMETYFLLGKK